MKNKKSLKKLSLNKENFFQLGANESEKVQGGLFGSHFVCTQSNAEVGCTSHSKCITGSTDITILCIDIP